MPGFNAKRILSSTGLLLLGLFALFGLPALGINTVIWKTIGGFALGAAAAVYIFMKK